MKLVIFQNVLQGFQLKIVALCDVTVGTTTFFRLMFTPYKCFNPLPNMSKVQHSFSFSRKLNTMVLAGDRKQRAKCVAFWRSRVFF